MTRQDTTVKTTPESPADGNTTPTRSECPHVGRVFTNGGHGRLLFCRLKEESMRGMNLVKRFFLKLTGHFLCSCPGCFCR